MNVIIIFDLFSIKIILFLYCISTKDMRTIYFFDEWSLNICYTFQFDSDVEELERSIMKNMHVTLECQAMECSQAVKKGNCSVNAQHTLDDAYSHNNEKYIF